ncbi:MAG: hypothetical protein ABSH39_03975 [Candidatus Acidiferrum sp.]
MFLLSLGVPNVETNEPAKWTQVTHRSVNAAIQDDANGGILNGSRVYTRRELGRLHRETNIKGRMRDGSHGIPSRSFKWMASARRAGGTACRQQAPILQA